MKPIFIFSSDHGDMFGSHGQPPWRKQVPWDESLCVPIPDTIEGEDLSAVFTGEAAPEDRAGLVMGVAPFGTDIPAYRGGRTPWVQEAVARS